MKNLTNLQLEILTDEIATRVGEAKKKYKETSEYAKHVETVKKNTAYSERIEFIEKLESLRDEKKAIEDAISSITKGFENKFNDGKRIYALNRIYVEQQLAESLEQSLTQFPKMQKIKSDIILASMTGAENIIEAVLNKYAL